MQKRILKFTGQPLECVTVIINGTAAGCIVSEYGALPGLAHRVELG